MNSRLRTTLASALCLLTVGVAAPLAHAAPKDAEALKLDKQAMDDDYLNVKFDEAEKKLRNALNICGASGCDPKVKARIYMDLGIILVNAKKQADATAAFGEGLKLDAGATPNPDFASDEVKKAFEAAKGSAPPPSTGTPPATNTATPPGVEAPNDLQHEPVTEGQVGYPVPIYVKATEGAAKFILNYKAPGAEFVKVEMKRMGKGFGAEIPCKDVKIAGKIRYYIVSQDAQGDTLGSAGNKKQPIEFDLKQKIAGELPAFPGKDPPEKCKGGGDCPPGMYEQGCKLQYGDKCTGPGQCDSGLACIERTCQTGKEEGGDTGDTGDTGGEEGGEPAKLNMISISGSLDVAVVNGTDLCSYENSVDGTYVCFRQDKGQRYYRPAYPGAVYDETIAGTKITQGATVSGPRDTGSLSGPPFARGTFRVLLGYDRAIPIKGQAFTPAVGVRLGYAFGGGPAVPNDKEGEKKFMPFHIELRGTMFFGKNVLARRGVRPYAFVSGGLAQVDAGISGIPVSDDCDIDGTEGSCPQIAGQKNKIQVDAYRKMGTGFAAIGGGALYAINKNSSLVLEVKGAAFFGSPGFAISPTLGFMQQLLASPPGPIRAKVRPSRPS